MDWYVVYTKPSQELRALDNLQRQGFECYCPLIRVEKVRRGKITIIDEPLFPRYLFVNQAISGQEAKSWASIRSTLGVTRLVTFGNEPARIKEDFIQQLQLISNGNPKELFTEGEKLKVIDGPYKGLEAVFKMRDGESRVMVLIEILGKQTSLNLSPLNLQKIQ